MLLTLPLAADKLPDIKNSLLRKGIKLLTKDEEEKEKHELVIDLKNPIYKNGILSTQNGGVIKGQDFRIQARKISYIRKSIAGEFTHKMVAEQDLMVQFKGKVYVGEKLEFDFTTKSGVIYNGKTYSAPLFLGGDKIILNSDGSYQIENVYITPCESTDNTWDIHANRIYGQKQDLLEAKGVKFRFYKIPTLYLPSFKINLKRFVADPVVRYSINWDKSSGPRASMRYQLYSWKEFELFGRLDWRMKRGFGGAIETEYYPEHGRSKCITKSYLATDTLPYDPSKRRRYRLQGVYDSISPSRKTKIHLTWDKYTDIHMPGDFKSDDFEINTAKRTELFVRHNEENILASLHARVRANNFETLKQDLPTLFATLKPIAIGSSGIIFENRAHISYLSQVYSQKLQMSLDDFHSARCDLKTRVYRPIAIGALCLTPDLGATGTFYHKTPQHGSAFLGFITYGGTLDLRIYRDFSRHRHAIRPYARYIGISHPTIDVNRHYIFSLQDGYEELNMVKIGLKNQLFSLRKMKSDPTFDLDLYANTFLHSNSTSYSIPKIYLDLSWNLPSICFIAKSCWNVQKALIDYSNLRFGWTVNKNAALSVEFRHRSRYDWRKGDRENFILDVYRHEDELLNSPLSDRRNTILTKMFFRLSPYWTCNIQSHYGWNRGSEPGYNEVKIDLFTMLSSNWRLRVSYLHTQRDDRVTAALALIKK